MEIERRHSGGRKTPTNTQTGEIISMRLSGMVTCLRVRENLQFTEQNDISLQVI